MRKQKTKGYSAKAAAVFMASAIVVQTVVPAMALQKADIHLSVSSAAGNGRTASPSEADKGDEQHKATPSDAITPEQPEKEKAEKENKAEKASPASAQRKEVKNLLPNGSFEDTEITSADWKWVWVNSIIPKGWKTWAATEGNKKMSFEVVADGTNACDGTNYLYIHSEDKASRIDINYPIHNIDPTVNYLCTFWVKAEAVEGTGFYVRLARLKKSDGKTETNVETPQIKGTTDGWVQYKVITKDLPSANTEGLQIDIFAEKMSGEIWLDDLQIVPTYSLNLNKTEANLLTEDTLQLQAECSDGFDEKIQWYSRNPEIADVDDNGIVTAFQMGVAEIVAKTDDYHEAVCKIYVEDGQLRPYYMAIRENWRNRLTGNDMEDTTDETYVAMMADMTEKAQAYWDTMEKGGNERTRLWADIDFTYKYQNTTKNITEGLGTGFSRLEQMATAYSAKGSGLYHNEELKADMISALEWVYHTMYNDTMSPQHNTYGNWWHWFIGMPQSLCNIVILMYEDLDQDLIDREAKTLENFNWDPNERYVVCGGSKVKNTAGNLIDTSLVSALRSAIGETSKPLNMAKKALDQSIGFVSSGNGYYEDGSYIDHGNLAYTGGYGSTLLGGMEKLLFIVDSSPWEVDSNKLTSIFQWIYNGIRPLYANGAMMDMTTGRGIARPSTNDQTVGRGLLKPISHLVLMAPEEEREAFRAFARTQIQAGLAYNDDYFIGMTVADMTAMKNLLMDSSLEEDDQVYHKNFGVMDKAVYHGENFDLGISMYSRRTGNFEYGNNENRKGWHMSDGALYLYNGDQSQYADVYWPTVDPHRLAGITTDHTEGFIPTGNSWNPHVSTRDWVGGSSVLNQYGAVGMDFEGETKSGGISSLKAKKSWFTFPNAVVALGAGISSSEGKTTETIVDNRKAMENASNTVWVDGEEAALVTGEPASMPMSWALLEGNNGENQNIGYYFPEETEVTVLKENRTGNWRDINTAVGAGSENDKEINRSYISFSVDHGINPQNEAYSYVLLPGRSPEEMAEFAMNPAVEILANTPEVQAVKNKAFGVSGYNFWSACDREDLEASAKTPASLTIAKESGRITVGISNPTQNGQDTTVILNSFYEAVEAEEGVTTANENGRTVITLEGKHDFGKTYSVVLVSMEEKLADWRNRVSNATLSEKRDIEAILAEAQALDLAQFSEEQKESVAAIITAIQEKLALMSNADKVLAPIRDVSEVTFENADEVEALIKEYDSLTEEEKALLSERDKEKLMELRSGFQKEEIHTMADGIVISAISANGAMDVRTTFSLNDESASIETYQEELPEMLTLFNLFDPELFLKDKKLSLEEHPLYITMKAPDREADGKGILKLYCFTPKGRSRASELPAEVPFTVNHNGTISFKMNMDGIYGFAQENGTDLEPSQKPEAKPSSDREDSKEELPDGVWIRDANGWWFKHYNGTWPSSQWKYIKGCWYHFNEVGYMETGWIMDKGQWYYLKPEGNMAVNEWILYKDQWYYLSNSGEILKNTFVTWNGVVYQLGKDGAMIE